MHWLFHVWIIPLWLWPLPLLGSMYLSRLAWEERLHWLTPILRGPRKK
jgi:hypothetical protein